MGTLFVVATPIGNLEDMTPRARRVLADVDLIAAEDTRRTKCLLRHFAIATPLVSYHAFNEQQRLGRLLEALRTGDVALVSDAGTPGISDPGNDLVAAVHAAGFTVSPIPGASALAAAVSVSGLVPDAFLSLGFLPREAGARKVRIARAAAAGVPVVLFEAAPRLATTLADLLAALGPRRAVVMRELTKVYETIVPGALDDLATWAQETDIRGELVIVVGGPLPATGPADEDEDDLDALITSLRQSGLSVSATAREAAAVTGRPKSELYDRAKTWRPAGAEATDSDPVG